MAWEGFDKFWINLFRDLLPHAQSGEARVAYDNASGNLTVEYKLASRLDAPDAHSRYLRSRAQRF